MEWEFIGSSVWMTQGLRAVLHISRAGVKASYGPDECRVYIGHARKRCLLRSTVFAAPRVGSDSPRLPQSLQAMTRQFVRIQVIQLLGRVDPKSGVDQDNGIGAPWS